MGGAVAGGFSGGGGLFERVNVGWALPTIKELENKVGNAHPTQLG